MTIQLSDNDISTVNNLLQMEYSGVIQLPFMAKPVKVKLDSLNLPKSVADPSFLPEITALIKEGGEKYNDLSQYLQLAAQTCGENIPAFLKWYLLGRLCEADTKLESPVFSKLLAKYVGGGKKDYSLSVFQHSNLEADYFVALRCPKPLEWSLYHQSLLSDDPSIIAKAGFRILDPETAIIENLQGVQKFQCETHWQDGSFTKTIIGNAELREIGWRSLLVKTMEHIMETMGITTVMFRSAETLMHRHQPMRTDIQKRYNGTALKMGYSPITVTMPNTKGYIHDDRKYLTYVKYLCGKKPHKLTLPYNRYGDC